MSTTKDINMIQRTSSMCYKCSDLNDGIIVVHKGGIICQQEESKINWSFCPNCGYQLQDSISGSS